MLTSATNKSSEMEIEANWGERDFAYSLPVDCFVVSKKKYTVVSKSIATKRKMLFNGELQDAPIDKRDIPSLKSGELQNLAQIGSELENEAGKPQQIEWIFSDGKFQIVQSKAIDDFTETAQLERLRRHEVETLEQKLTIGGTIWSQFGLAERVTTPLPMTWALIENFMSASGGFGQAYRELGFIPSYTLKSESIAEMICGRLYINLTNEAQIYSYGLPIEHSFTRLRREPQKAIYPTAKLELSHMTVSSWLKFPFTAIRMVRAKQKFKANLKKLSDPLSQKIFPEFREYASEQRRVFLQKLSDGEVLEHLEKWRNSTFDVFGKFAVKIFLMAEYSYGQLEILLSKYLDDAKLAESLAKTSIAGLEENLTIEAHKKMWKVAQGESSIEKLIGEYGHHATDEFELAQPRWRKVRSDLEQTIEFFRTTPSANPEKRQIEQLERRQKYLSKLEELSSAQQKKVYESIELTRKYVNLLENTSTHFILGYELMRRALHELGRRHKLGDEIFFLMPKDLEPPIDRENLKRIINKRRLERSKLLQLELPNPIYSDELNKIGDTSPIGKPDYLHGTGVSPGVQVGTAMVVSNPSQAVIDRKNFVLVCRSIEDCWSPVFLGAKAIVVECGGILSHFSIVARDYGIPMVVACIDATKLLRSGEKLCVDGTSGIVSIEVAEEETTEEFFGKLE